MIVLFIWETTLQVMKLKTQPFKEKPTNQPRKGKLPALRQICKAPNGYFTSTWEYNNTWQQIRP